MVETQTHPSDGIVRWHADHANFARLLSCLQSHADTMAAGDTPNYGLMIDILTYLRRYPDRYHHPREDEAFARLRARDPAAAPEADALAREHRELADGGQALLDQLEEALADVVFSRPALSSRLARYINAYREHIAAEESVIMPRAAALLTAADWSAIADAESAGPDPLFGESSDGRYRELRQSIALSDGEAP